MAYIKMSPNKGKCKEDFFPREHLKFNDLRKNIVNEYLAKYEFIPKSPRPVEFYVSNLRHDTNFGGFQGILSDGGFKNPSVGITNSQRLVWWSLAVSDSDIADAEQRFLHQYRLGDQCFKPFLHKFTSSPAFRKSSRLGNFRFTFSIKDLLGKYSAQFCMGQEPQMRIYGTVVYKQEVMYAIVVHGPDGQTEFEKYPLFKVFPKAVCAFQDEKMLWRPESMSKTHAFRLCREMRVSRIQVKKREYYMWDNVAVAFHVPQDKIFEFEREMLLKHLSLCQGVKPKLSNEDFIKCEFEASAMQNQ